MAANYVLLEKITVGAAKASSITFSGIPQTGYTDLVIRASTRMDLSSANAWNYNSVTFNGSGTGYTGRYINGNNTTVSSATPTAIYAYGNTQTASANIYSNFEIYIPNYTSSSFKTVSVDGVTEQNGNDGLLNLGAYLWSNTAAITSITITPVATEHMQYSTFYLYGVAKLGTTPVISPYATGGDIIDTDGTYWYHTFLSSGTFTPQKALSVDYLVVAGGGGGGGAGPEAVANGGGGGGAGGFRTATGFSCASGTGLTVTIGAGGAGGAGTTAGGSGGNNGSAGSNSVFSTITSTGGGYGSLSQGTTTPGNGGSGGGGGADSSPRTGGTGTSGQGSNGGTGINAPQYRAGGGGGASAAGADGSVSGNGGAGTASSYSGSSVTYAGGGGGGTYNGSNPAGSGGAGGGGAGGKAANGTAGTANTGGGGGGAGATTPGGTNGAAGGSGIVLVRYAV